MIETQAKAWAPLKNELEVWSQEGLEAHLWLRDDDAIKVTPALERLDDLCTRFGVPYTIATIPSLTTQTLAQWATSHTLGNYAVHGFSHTNHAPIGDKKCELGLHRGERKILSELAEGFEKLANLFEAQSAPLLVPPWNRIDYALIPHLRALGFKGLSTYGWPKPSEPHGLTIINTHIDIIDWKGSRGGLPRDVLIDNLVEALQTARALNPTQPPAIGILSHHLVHDELAWQFLEELMSFSANNNQITWQSAKQIAQL